MHPTPNKPQGCSARGEIAHQRPDKVGEATRQHSVRPAPVRRQAQREAAKSY